MVRNVDTENQYVDLVKELATKKAELAQPKWDHKDFFKQRNKHRKVLFRFALVLSSLSLLFLFVIIGIQIFVRAKYNSDFEVISDYGLEIVAVSIFGQVFGVVYVIAKSVWSNDEFNLIKKK